MISIVDYGAANLGSMRNMLRRIGVETEFAATPEAVRAATKLILPGVGAFDHGMRALAARGLIDPIRESVVARNIPILGVCLGMQILADGSEEGSLRGLGLVQGYCRRLQGRPEAGIRIPHMGWKQITRLRDDEIFAGWEPDARFYFVHSYHVVCHTPDDVLATASHGAAFTAMIGRGRIYGAQFHSEKSHRFGMLLLRRFAEL